MQFFGVGRDWILKVLSSLFFLRFFVYGKRESGDKRIKGFAVVFFTFSAQKGRHLASVCRKFGSLNGEQSRQSHKRINVVVVQSIPLLHKWQRHRREPRTFPSLRERAPDPHRFLRKTMRRLHRWAAATRRGKAPRAANSWLCSGRIGWNLAGSFCKWGNSLMKRAGHRKEKRKNLQKKKKTNFAADARVRWLTYANRGRLERGGWGRRPTAASWATPYWLPYWSALNWRMREYSLVGPSSFLDSAGSPVHIQTEIVSNKEVQQTLVQEFSDCSSDSVFHRRRL